MQIIYCDTCGVRIPEGDLKSGVALQEGPQRAFCAQCSLTQPPTRENAVLTRTTRPVQAVSSSQRHGAQRVAQPQAESKSNALWIAMGVGAGIFGLLLILFAGRASRSKTPPNDDSQPLPAQATAPVAPPVKPKPPEKPSETVTLSRPPITPATPPTPAIDDIRENFARRKWNDVKAEAEKGAGPSGLIVSSPRTKVRDFSRTYASTAAGKEAAEFLKKMTGPDIPTPGATVFAVYSRDFKRDTPAPAWRYLWNPAGPVGDSSKYAPLIWNEKQGAYAGSPTEYPGGPSVWIRLDGQGGHPGQGTEQAIPTDRFAIAAYTLQAGQSGKTVIFGRIGRNNPDGGRIDLRIFVNDTLKDSAILTGSGGPQEFFAALGDLKSGDNVYVCVGPDRNDGSDTFGLDFTIFPAP